MIEEVNKSKRFNWWWLLLIASSALFRDSTGGWVMESRTMGAGTLVIYNLSLLVGTMIFGFMIPLLITLVRVIFKGRSAWIEGKGGIVRTTAILMTVFAGLVFVEYLVRGGPHR